MKTLIILLLMYCITSVAQVITIKGKVIDAKTGQQLINANIVLQSDKVIGTVSDSEGKFTLSGNLNQDDLIEISFLGYEKVTKLVSSFFSSSELNTIELNPAVLSSQSILVQAFLRKDESIRINNSTIDRTNIKNNYTLQDVPEFLSSTPSTTFYSESGNGIGYSYLSIRGFDQRRISVSVNGIPQNDPEDHNVYWLDFPDLISSADLIQVQRGSSSSIIGYPAIGGSINIITSSFANEPSLSFQVSLGSYNTRKYGIAFSSGLIGEKYSFHAKLSQILSSGYKEKSWVKFNSYHLSAIRYDDKLTSQINIYGGPISDGLAYTGVPKFTVKDKNTRRKNYSYWEADHEQNKITYAAERRSDEIENFSQPHFELLNDYKLDDDLSFNSALFLVLGEGYFDYDGSWADTSYLRLTAKNGFTPNNNPQNVLIRAQVENTQFGWIPRVNINHQDGKMILGAEFRKHKSVHWGGIDYGENLPNKILKDFRYYYYNGGKNILNIFVNENYRLNEKISLLGELQLAYHQYRLHNEKYVGTDFKIDNLFMNSRLGMNYTIDTNKFLQFTYARVSREPRLKDYYDAAESSGEAVPQFEKKADGSFDFNKPYVQPETMNDFEIGAYFSSNWISVTLNLFYMLFEDEIVKNGKLDRFGQPITGNADNTVHQGIELSISAKLFDGFEILSNTTISKNIIRESKYFINSFTSLDLSGNRISGFPDFLWNLVVSYQSDEMLLKLNGKYVGKFYSDNFANRIPEYSVIYPGFVDYLDNENDAYFTLDFFGSYSFNFIDALSSSKVFFQVNNIFNRLYSAQAIGKEFFPAAERNILAGIQIGL